MKRGLFITFEGPEGAGKTTVINMISEELLKRGYNVLQTREPGGIEIAEKIRSIILDKEHTKMDPKTEALLYAAARRQHLVEKVIPALENDQIVLCDRFIDSSLAYQGHARGLGLDSVFSINQFAIGDEMPSLTIYFDIDPKLGLDRINMHKDREVNRLDLEDLSFHYKVSEGYEILLAKFPGRIIRIDASDDLKSVFESVLNAVIDKLS